VAGQRGGLRHRASLGQVRLVEAGQEVLGQRPVGEHRHRVGVDGRLGPQPAVRGEQQRQPALAGRDGAPPPGRVGEPGVEGPPAAALAHLEAGGEDAQHHLPLGVAAERDDRHVAADPPQLAQRDAAAPRQPPLRDRPVRGAERERHALRLAGHAQVEMELCPPVPRHPHRPHPRPDAVPGEGDPIAVSRTAEPRRNRLASLTMISRAFSGQRPATGSTWSHWPSCQISGWRRPVRLSGPTISMPSIGGSRNGALAASSRADPATCPPSELSRQPRRSGAVPSCTPARASAVEAASASAAAASAIARRGSRPAARSTTSMFSAAVSRVSRPYDCRTSAISRRSPGFSASGTPPTSTCPPTGGSSPARVVSRVVFPRPGRPHQREPFPGVHLEREIGEQVPATSPAVQCVAGQGGLGHARLRRIPRRFCQTPSPDRNCVPRGTPSSRTRHNLACAPMVRLAQTASRLKYMSETLGHVMPKALR